MADRDDLVWLWNRLVEAYGLQWLSSYGAEPNDTWTAGLRDLERPSLQRGLRASVMSGEDFPPNLSQFRRRCVGLPTKAELIEAAVHGDSEDPVTRSLVRRLRRDASTFDLQRMTVTEAQRYFRARADKVLEAALRHPGPLLELVEASAREALPEPQRRVAGSS